MSTLQMTQNVTAIGFGNSTFFGASGGTAPYTFAITTSGAGGTIHPFTGKYTAPYQLISTPATSVDGITVTDSTTPTPQTASSTITVGGALELLCDIIQQGMSLPNDRVWIWDQKINMPSDNGLYVAVSVASCKPFGNSTSYEVVSLSPLTNLFSFRTYPYPADPNTSPFNTYSSFHTDWNWYSYAQFVNGSLASVQSVNMQAMVEIDVISRGPAARDQKELVLMALQSVYSQQQQEANSFYISRLSSSFLNLSQIDGAAIPYRFKIGVSLIYFVKNITSVPYFTTFNAPSVVVNA